MTILLNSKHEKLKNRTAQLKCQPVRCLSDATASNAGGREDGHVKRGETNRGGKMNELKGYLRTQK